MAKKKWRKIQRSHLITFSLSSTMWILLTFFIHIWAGHPKRTKAFTFIPQKNGFRILIPLHCRVSRTTFILGAYRFLCRFTEYSSIIVIMFHQTVRFGSSVYTNTIETRNVKCINFSMLSASIPNMTISAQNIRASNTTVFKLKSTHEIWREK